MEKYGVLVVDDSAYMRKIIGSIIEACPNLYVIAKARNGIDAIEKVKRLKPAIVTLDIEMPELDGLSTLKFLMAETPVPVVMLSNGEDSILEAIELGAVDFIIKSSLIKENNNSEIKDFHKRLNVAAKANFLQPIKSEIENVPPVKEKKKVITRKHSKEIILIGSSTGGPAALQKIITEFPSSTPVPIMVIQHMPPGFTKPLAERFDKFCELKVKEAEHNEILEAGTIYIAPAGIQTTLRKNDEGQFIVRQKISSHVETLYKPSVDVTLLSVSQVVKEKVIVVILTGMGDDGLRGCTAIKKNGGTVIVESEETCVVYGMPKVVFEAGLVDKKLPLSQIFHEIMIELYKF